MRRGSRSKSSPANPFSSKGEKVRVCIPAMFLLLSHPALFFPLVTGNQNSQGNQDRLDGELDPMEMLSECFPDSEHQFIPHKLMKKTGEFIFSSY